jgi:hypothetical protein
MPPVTVAIIIVTRMVVVAAHCRKRPMITC